MRPHGYVYAQVIHGMQARTYLRRIFLKREFNEGLTRPIGAQNCS